MEEALDILAFAPHPDDVELGCGGSLIAAADKGWRVAVADLTAGELSSRGTLEQREQETRRATELLGLTARYSLGLPDGGIGTHPDHRLPIIDVVRRTRPRIRAGALLGGPPSRPFAVQQPGARSLLLRRRRQNRRRRAVSPPLFYYYLLHTPFAPSFIMDVSSVWERRMAAVRAYESQFMAAEKTATTALSRPGFLRALEARAVWFGWMIGANYGEPFLSATPMAVGSMPGLPPRDDFPRA